MKIKSFSRVTLEFWHFIPNIIIDLFFMLLDFNFCILKKFFKKIEFVCVTLLLRSILRTTWNFVFNSCHTSISNFFLENRIIDLFWMFYTSVFQFWKIFWKKYKFVCVTLLFRSILRTIWKFSIFLVLNFNFDNF